MKLNYVLNVLNYNLLCIRISRGVLDGSVLRQKDTETVLPICVRLKKCYLKIKIISM